MLEGTTPFSHYFLPQLPNANSTRWNTHRKNPPPPLMCVWELDTQVCSSHGDDMSNTVAKSYKNSPTNDDGHIHFRRSQLETRFMTWDALNFSLPRPSCHGNVNISWINFSISSLTRRRCNKNTKGKLSKCNNMNDDNDWKNAEKWQRRDSGGSQERKIPTILN